MILPSHLLAGSTPEHSDGGAFGQVMLRQGEVTAVVYPDDPRSLSQRFVEYSVRAQVRSGGTAGVVDFPHCLIANPLAGMADSARWRLRADPAAGVDGKPGLGSKVLLLCINGERANAFIVGGIRDQADDDTDLSADEPLGLDWTYNGLHVEVGNDGSVTVRMDGPTKPDGTLDTDVVDAADVGAQLSLEGDGSAELAGPKAKDSDGNDQADDDPHQQLVRIDHAAKTLTVLADESWTVTVQGDATVSSGNGLTLEEREQDVAIAARKGDVEVTADGQIRLGAAADEPAVLGNRLKSLFGDLMTELSQLSVFTSVGPSGPPLAAQRFQQFKQQFDDVLSGLVFVKK